MLDLTQMKFHLTLGAFVALFFLIGTDVGAETITHARYSNPVDRYGHFAPGQPHEYSDLVVTTDTGRRLVLQLPEEEVFEDVKPRLLRLARREPEEILTIVSSRKSGSRLAVIGLDGDQLKINAQSRPIGTPMRWLNPVGVADLDGDGRAEIAAVITPHIGGTLKVYRRTGINLVEITALTGFSNHIYGSPELRLSTPASIAGQMRLLVPDVMRQNLRIIAFADDGLAEIGGCELGSPITGAIRVMSAAEVTVEVSTGQQLIDLNDCL